MSLQQPIPSILYSPSISHHSAHVSYASFPPNQKLLKKIGLSYQKAGFITDRVDQEEYEKKRKIWLTETWPAILKQAKKEKAVILFGDEVSFAMWGSLSRTWAPKGQQPLVKKRNTERLKDVWCD